MSQLMTMSVRGTLAISRPQITFSPRHLAAGRPAVRRGSPLTCRSGGGDVVDSWLDLASFVAGASGGGAHTPFDELADAIGKEIYIDVQGWHLYLKDVKVPGSQITMAQALAAKLGAQIQGQGFKQAAVENLIKAVPIKLGKDKTTVALADVLPGGCIRDLMDVCEEWERKK